MQEPFDRHAPTTEFAARLEARITGDIRRRNHDAVRPRWASWTTWQVAAAVTAIIVISMAAGGAAVAAAYEAADAQVRDQLVVGAEERLQLATRRLELAHQERQATERRFEVGMVNTQAVLEAGVQVAIAEAQVAGARLDLDEIRASGREPRKELWAPRVNGRDFVGDRLQAELTVPVKALEVERTFMEAIVARVEIGTTAPQDLETARVRIAELEASVQAIRRRIEIRKLYLSGRIDATVSELRSLEVEAEQQVSALTPKVALAREQVQRLTERSKVGVVSSVEVAEAELRRLELETELSKAQLDLTVIRQRLAKHREP